MAVDPTVTTLDINMKVDVGRPDPAADATPSATKPASTTRSRPWKVAVGVDVPRFLNEFMTRISGLAAKRSEWLGAKTFRSERFGNLTTESPSK